MKNLISVIILSLFLVSLQNNNSDSRFVIALVGNGLDLSGNAPLADWPRNRSQAVAMAKGAEAAFYNSPQLEELRKIAVLKRYDDGDRDDLATEIAHRLQKDPKVLAIVGHGTSSTSMAAGWIYAQAQIPMLMPIATNPRTMVSPVDSSRHLRNIFRLPPNDELVQVPTIAYLSWRCLQRSTNLLNLFGRGTQEENESSQSDQNFRSR